MPGYIQDEVSVQSAPWASDDPLVPAGCFGPGTLRHMPARAAVMRVCARGGLAGDLVTYTGCHEMRAVHIS